MKTKYVNWITLLPLACLVILLGMGVKSQHSSFYEQKTVRDSIIPVIGVRIPDSTQIKLSEKSKSMTRIDSLVAVDSAWGVKNAKAIVAVAKKKERFEQYRKTPNVKQIPASNPSLVVNAPSLPDTINLKKKSKRTVFDKVKDFITKP
jgi:hypothetical protein